MAPAISTPQHPTSKIPTWSERMLTLPASESKDPLRSLGTLTTDHDPPTTVKSAISTTLFCCDSQTANQRAFNHLALSGSKRCCDSRRARPISRPNSFGMRTYKNTHKFIKRLAFNPRIGTTYEPPHPNSFIGTTYKNRGEGGR